jgi:hypothetical protein
VGGGDGVRTEAGADRGAPLPGSRAQEAVSASGEAAVRQHVWQNPTQARVGRHGRGARLSRGGGLVLNRDRAICPREAAVVADGHAQAGRRQGAAGVLATPDGLAVYAPVRVPDVRLHARAQVGLWQVGAARRAEASRQGGDVEQAVWGSRQPGALGREPPARDEGMHVGRVAQRAGPGMEPPPSPSRPPMPRGSHASAWTAAAERRKRRWARGG